MTKKEIIKADMIAAMKCGDKECKKHLSYLIGIIQNAEIDKKRDLTDDEVNEIVNKQIKQTMDVIKVTPEDRRDIIEDNELYVSILNRYAPKMMDEKEIRHEIYSVCAEMKLDINNLTGKDRGKIMGKLMPRVKGKADGSIVNKIVSEYCK